MSIKNSFSFAEFFAGGGMVRQALDESWACCFANDFDGKKALAYQENWGVNGELSVCDIRDVKPEKIGASIDLAWASFPCQDLSLAGKGIGLRSERSGMFFVFWDKIRQASTSGKMPKLVVIENVCGLLTSNEGNDFKVLVKTFSENGYNVGGVVIDAKDFVPQSRKRVFVVGVRTDIDIDPILVSTVPTSYHPTSLQNAYSRLDSESKNRWVWFNLPIPEFRKTTLIDILEPEHEVVWDIPSKTNQLVNSMTPTNYAKVRAAQLKHVDSVGALFKRTRSYNGVKNVFAEVRFDGVSGCLRTPNGGSSKQSILWVSGENLKSRLLTPRETARLMGLPEDYKLPKNNNSALHLTGDGVVVPVVKHLKNYLFEPLLSKALIFQKKPYIYKIYN